MAWKTLREAAAEGPSRATWERRVAAGTVPSYLNEFGRRMVWVGEAPSLDVLQRDLGSVRQDLWSVLQGLSSLKTELSALRQDMERAFAAPHTLRKVA